MSEIELARKVVEYLHREQWEVYQEVKGSYGRCDIYAVRGPVSWAIECKTTCSLKVIEQAVYWQGYANYTSIAVPSSKSSHIICRRLGIGVLTVQGGDFYAVQEYQPSEYRRHIMRPHLCEEQKNYAEAGNADSRFYSPFRGTCDRLRDFVASNPGALFADALRGIQHHYNSDSGARASLSQWIQAGKVPGVRMEHRGRNLLLYPQQATGPKP